VISILCAAYYVVRSKLHISNTNTAKKLFAYFDTVMKYKIILGGNLSSSKILYNRKLLELWEVQNLETCQHLPGNTMKPRPTRQYLPASTYQAIPSSQHLPGNTFQPTPTRQYLPAKTYKAIPSIQDLPGNTLKPRPTR